MTLEDEYEAAEYDGKKVTLNKPFRLPKGNSKKFGVYVKNEKGNVVKVRFGDPNMEIKRDNPKRRKAFRDRHNCASPGPKWKPRYWSCKMWSSKPVKDLTSNFDKSDDTMTSVMGCGCGCDGEAVKAAEPTPKDDESHEQYMSRCQEMGYSEEECMKAHDGHEFKVESEYKVCDSCTSGEACTANESCNAEADYGDSCPPGQKMKDGKCVRVAVTCEVVIEEVSTVVKADTGETVIQITGVAFHEGMNKNGWEITRVGAENLLTQMVGADVTLNHPHTEGGRFTRNMSGGIDEAVVGFITDAFLNYHADGRWDVRYVAEVTRKELFSSLESGLWLREGYGVSIGGTGIPDDIVEAEDGSMSFTFETDFTFDHLAIVHLPAYERANIESVERIEAVKYQPDSPTINNEAINMTDDIISEEKPDNSAEIEALKADLILKNAEIEAFKAAQAAKAEESRMALVTEATELGMSGHDELSTDTLTNLIASWREANPPQVEEEVVLEPVSASVTETPSAPKAEVSMIASYFNKQHVEIPEDMYAQAYNLWAKAWNKTLTPSETTFRAKTYEQIKEVN